MEGSERSALTISRPRDGEAGEAGLRVMPRTVQFGSEAKRRATDPPLR